MAYVRLFRRVRLAPGVTLNLAKHGPSVSFGVRGAHLTVGRSGIRKTVGIPGTGLFATSTRGWYSGVHTGQPFHEAAGKLTGWRRFGHDLLLIGLAWLALIITVWILTAL